MEVTYKQVRVFRINAVNYMNEHKDETKLNYALKKALKTTDSIEVKFNDFISDTELENAATDDKGVVLFTINEAGTRVFSFKKEGLKERDRVITKKFEESENEIEPYKLTEWPKDIAQEWIDAFAPFIEK